MVARVAYGDDLERELLLIVVICVSHLFVVVELIMMII